MYGLREYADCPSQRMCRPLYSKWGFFAGRQLSAPDSETRGSAFSCVSNPYHLHVSSARIHGLLVAYLIGARRGFAPGHEPSDWLAAEREVNRVCDLSDPSPPGITEKGGSPAAARRAPRRTIPGCASPTTVYVPSRGSASTPSRHSIYIADEAIGAAAPHRVRHRAPFAGRANEPSRSPGAPRAVIPSLRENIVHP